MTALLIGPSTLEAVLRLRIDDYSQDASLRKLVRSYHDLLVEYIGRGQFKNFMHSRDFF